MGRGLSELQERLLVRIYSATVQVESSGNEFPQREAEYWGVPWRMIRSCKPSRTLSAAVSRALCRLEKRGLIQRRNRGRGDKHQPDIYEGLDGRMHKREPVPEFNRLDHIRLTPEGREAVIALVEKRT